jgi:predicted O-methyltransferase YrrM
LLIMGTPFATRVVLKIKKVARELTKTSDERQFRRIWPLIDSIQGWLYFDEAQWLYVAARSLSDHSNIVEIGSYHGRSTCCLAVGCRESGKRVFAIDSFDGGPDLPRADSLAQFQSNIERLHLADYVQPIVGISTEVAKDWDKPIHLLFIDGSHLYEDVMADFASFFPHVAPGGLVAFHDVQQAFPGVLKAWNEMFEPKLTRTGLCETLGYGTKPGE